MLEPWVAQSVSHPSCSPWIICMQVWDRQLPQCLPSIPVAALPHVLSTRLPVSIPPTSLDGCFFSNSLVVGLPYSSIFWQFWLFLFLNLLLSFFWCVKRQSVSTYASTLARSPVTEFYAYDFVIKMGIICAGPCISLMNSFIDDSRPLGGCSGHFSHEQYDLQQD